uniref:G_PROTEIN_RECEP_F1_2 domain-containing protein n=1 Tax=Rhabditophanes sp. KR3021 TaxID=114890 RepID=A0AC35TSF6_9BILA
MADIPHQFLNCSNFVYPHDLKYSNCSIDLYMNPCDSLHWLHLANNFRTYFLVIIPFVISIFAIILNSCLLFCVFKQWKTINSSNTNTKKNQLIFKINRSVSSLFALISFYALLLVWKLGGFKYSSASIFIIVATSSFLTLAGFYFATTILLYLAIVYPLYYKSFVTKRKCYIASIFIWVFALSFAIAVGLLGATLFYPETAPITCDFKKCQLPVAIILTVIVTILYISVITVYLVMMCRIKVHTKSKPLHNGPNSSPTTKISVSSYSISNSIKAMNRLSFNLITFMISNCPFIILALVTVVNLHKLSSIGFLAKTACKHFANGK